MRFSLFIGFEPISPPPFDHDTETDSVALREFDVKELVYVKIG